MPNSARKPTPVRRPYPESEQDRHLFFGILVTVGLLIGGGALIVLAMCLGHLLRREGKEDGQWETTKEVTKVTKKKS